MGSGYLHLWHGSTMGTNSVGLQRKLTREEHFILMHYERMADAIARCFGSACEVVVHSLEDTNRSVVKIVNGHVTGRTIGAPVTDLGLEILAGAHNEQGDVVGPYTSTTSTGNILHSVTNLIRNNKGRIIGFLCINFNLSASLTEVFSAFGGDDQQSRDSSVREHYSRNVHDLVADTYRGVLEPLRLQEGISPLERNKRVVAALHRKGIFNIKGSVEIVAECMGVSKFTVYSYLRQHRSGEPRRKGTAPFTVPDEP